jgi:hypothetical protein
MIIVILIPVAIYTKNKLEIQNLPSTDLSSIYIEGIQLNENISNIDLSRFKPSMSLDNVTKGNLGYVYYENFSLVKNQEGTIVQLKTSVPETNAVVNRHKISTMADIEVALGQNYVTRTYDWEQGLTSKIYYDKNRKILVRFIYPKTKNMDRLYLSISLETY